MLRTFNYNENVRLSEHFNSIEFRCKCGKIHNYTVDTNLIDKLERLYSALNASKGIISSGYRCTTHDRAVGGNGYGQHTKGTACDIIFYDKNNKPISSKIVSCKAQDLGFGGIANINTAYTYTHLDVRSGYKYYGNEIYGTNTVTNNFYTYYGITKDNTSDKIDVSYRVYSGGKWWSEITNYNDRDSMGYAGVENQSIRGLAVKVNKGSIKYRVHKKGGNWFGWITAYNINDWNTGVAGSKNIEIDGIQIDFSGVSGYEAKYRVSTIGSNAYLSWVVGTSDYAGIFGKAIDKVQIEIIKA